MTDNTRSSSVAAGIVGTSIVVVGILLGVAAAVASNASLSEPVRLPLLVMIGLVALLGVLAAMAIAFKTMHLANQTQALGLPEGTIRAVIALSLILIFAVITVYLFSELSDPCCETDKGKPAARSAPVSTSTVVTTTAGSTTTMVTTTDPNKPIPVSDEEKARAAAAQDFAKQLLIMLGTLITSITSFYFGSRTAETPTSRPAPPKVSALDPTTLKTTDLPKPVSAAGSNLLLVDSVILRPASGSDVAATDVSSAEGKVLFTVPAGTPAGPWSVVLKTKEGVEAIAAATLTIT